MRVRDSVLGGGLPRRPPPAPREIDKGGNRSLDTLHKIVGGDAECRTGNGIMVRMSISCEHSASPPGTDIICLSYNMLLLRRENSAARSGKEHI